MNIINGVRDCRRNTSGPFMNSDASSYSSTCLAFRSARLEDTNYNALLSDRGWRRNPTDLLYRVYGGPSTQRRWFCLANSSIDEGLGDVSYPFPWNSHEKLLKSLFFWRNTNERKRRMRSFSRCMGRHLEVLSFITPVLFVFHSLYFVHLSSPSVSSTEAATNAIWATLKWPSSSYSSGGFTQREKISGKYSGFLELRLSF